MSTEVDWSFRGNWPYQPKWFDTDAGRLHYVDEGPRDGTPVVMVHGNPTWGYLYRRFVAAVVKAGHRAIVMDHLGFGRSDKPGQRDLYQVPEHAARCEALLESLELVDAILVVQDWGGPIGLAWAARHHDRVAKLFILNTFFQRPSGKVPLPLPLKLFRTPGVGELMVKGFNAFVTQFLFKSGLSHPASLTELDRLAYLAPHPSWSSRTGMLEFPRQIPADGTGAISEFVAGLNPQLVAGFREKPVRIVWPMQDVAFRPNTLEEMWLPDFPHAEVTRVDAGHYIQEDAHQVVIPALLDFIAASA
ncbi:MAG TPA: alpha/beta hydrolase [Halieaceae bacterium]|nr:alpha/beta hydrolase [Haliea sp.]HBX74020.1 alpha/beta hydrolase [Halieaceae bacterium]|tara:strand:+ start:703 stop:1614 length:912 start_codon:yes stop_codon:yes gene_type:complete